MKKLTKKKLIIFDLDGVLMNSKKNMKTAWNSTNKKYKLNVKFSDYFKHIGKPFSSILKSLDIFSKIKLIEREYSKVSIKNFNKIKLFKNVKKVLNLLRKKNNIITAIVTSKDYNRTKKILKFFKLKVDYVQCPQKGLRGKPHPDQIIKVVQKYKISKRNCFYVGDTIFDKGQQQKVKLILFLQNMDTKLELKI